MNFFKKTSLLLVTLLLSSILAQPSSQIKLRHFARIRTGPGKNFDIVNNLQAGTILQKVGNEGDWIKVIVKDTLTGWIYKPLVSEKQPPVVLDDFTKAMANKKCPNYSSSDIISERFGYCIYCDDKSANVDLSNTITEDGKNALRINFDLDRASWISIRKEFRQPRDLYCYTGICCDIKVEVPCTAQLRFTLVDIVKSENKTQLPNDELWWCTFKSALLNDKSNSWISLNMPYTVFESGYGVGSRLNNLKQDFWNIIAFELNILPDSNQGTKGNFLLKDLMTYF